MANAELDNLGSHCAQICVDMQRMFAEPTEWQAPWMNKVLPAVEALVEAHAARTVFTRFMTPDRPEASHGPGSNILPAVDFDDAGSAVA